MLTSELKGAQLDYWVAKAMGYSVYLDTLKDQTWLIHDNDPEDQVISFNPHKDCWDVGPLIDEKRISLRQVDDLNFKGKIIIASIEPQYPIPLENPPVQIGAGWWSGNTAPEAICRCIVASVYGNEVLDFH